MDGQESIEHGNRSVKDIAEYRLYVQSQPSVCSGSSHRTQRLPEFIICISDYLLTFLDERYANPVCLLVDAPEDLHPH